MTRLEMLPPHFFLIFLLAFINNMALTSPQTNKKGPPNLRAVPPTSFSCEGRTAGYYADPDAECQAYHMCDTQERQYSYLCPGFTLFNQKYMVCDHWHAVNCSIAPQYYILNNKIGQVPEKKSTAKKKIVKNIIRDQKPQRPRKVPPAFKFSHSKPSLPRKRNQPNTQDFTDKLKQTRTTVIPLLATTKSVKSTPATLPTKTVETPTPPPTISAPPATATTTTSKPSTKSTVSIRILSPVKEFSFSPNLVKVEKNNHPINARGSGLKIKFGGLNTDDSLEEKLIRGIKFRPLLKEPEKILFDKRNFTVPPAVLTTPSPSSQEDEDNGNSVSHPVSLTVEPLIPFLIPPLVESPQNSNASFLSVTPFLVPPLRGPVILQGENQEKRTPLVISRVRPLSARRLGIFPPQSIVPPSFSFSRSNRDFFIPAPGLIPPFPDNSISDEDDTSQSGNSLFIPLQMTMTFPNSTITRRRRPLRRNPNCPRCHPAFLRANECQPCVIIK